MSNNFNFEEKIKQIEEIVEVLDRGEIGLDEMLKQFEVGISLADQCRQYLDLAEQKVIDITKDKGNLF